MKSVRNHPTNIPFTATQWHEIRSAVRDGCTQPSHFNYDGLVDWANFWHRAQPQYVSPSLQKLTWRRISKLMRQAREALHRVDPRGLCDHIQPGPDEGHRAPHYPISKVLDHWEWFADVVARDELSVAENPRFIFFSNVLELWVDAGGFLRVSRGNEGSCNRGKLGGPTIRFVKAVTSPLMGKDTPSPEGFRKIIERVAVELEQTLIAFPRYAAAIRAVQQCSECGRAEVIERRAGRRTVRPITKNEARLLVRGPRRKVSAA